VKKKRQIKEGKNKIDGKGKATSISLNQSFKINKKNKKKNHVNENKSREKYCIRALPC